MINSNEISHIMTHRIHGVMAFMAMKRPIAFLVSQEFKLSHLTYRNIGSDFIPAISFWGRSTISPRNLELMAMQMNGVISHG